MHGGIKMIKKCLFLLFALILYVNHAFSAPQSNFLSTENNLWFTTDVVKNAIVEHIPADKQQPVATLYQELMDTNTGRISVSSLFKVCEKAGFNTKRSEGYEKCKQFIEQMLTDAEVATEVNLGGFCPGPDKNGKNPNSLNSITNTTRIGDVCTSTNIAYGEVVFKTGYACTCLAMQCNPGYRFRKRGDCIAPNQDPSDNNANASNYCPRQQHVGNTNNNSSEKCKNLCSQQYNGKSCYWDAVIWDKSKNLCICNPTNQEIATKRQQDEERRRTRKYYNPCNRGDKGKSGGQEFCIDKPFEWVNVTRMQGVELAKLYARKHNNDEIECADATETKLDFAGYDDFIMCASTDANNYYAFRFDDVKESFDRDIQAGLVNGICQIYGYRSNVQQNDSLRNLAGNFGCLTTCNEELKTAGTHFGLSVTQKGNVCSFEQRVINAKQADAQLAKINGLDNYHFKNDQTQIQAAQGIGPAIYGYIQSQGFLVRSLDCIPNTAKLQNKWYQDNDDIIRCNLNNKPIDFVFDDVAEAWSYKYEAGEGTLSCLGSGGKYQGNECYGLSQQQCNIANQRVKEINPGSSGTRWDAKNSVCVLVDQTEAAAYDTAIQIGTSAIAVIDCVAGSKIGCVMFAVEAGGLAADLTSKGLIGERVKEFLRASTVCKSRNCAKNTIRTLGARVIGVKDALDTNAIKNIDEELARLILLLKPEDLKSEMTGNDWNAIVAAAGGSTNDWTGHALVWMGRIGVVAQFASLTVSGVNLLKKSASALKTILSSADNIVAAADDVADVAKAIAVADATSDGMRALGAADDVADAARATDAVTDMARSMSYTDELAEVGVRHVVDKNGISRYLDINNGNKFLSHEEVLRRIDDIPAALARKANIADDVADASRAANAADDLSDAARGASNIVDDAADASKAANAADDVSDATRGAANATDDAMDANRVVQRAIPADFSPAAKQYIMEIDEIGKTRDYVVIKGVGRHNNTPPFSAIEDNYINQMLKDRNDLIVTHITQPNGSGGNLGSNKIIVKKTSDMFSAETDSGISWLRRVKTKPIGNLQGKTITTINGKKVFLEPLDNGGFIGGISGRPVVVVNYNGHKIPFYASSGSAGKLDVPTGKWEVFFGFGNNGWFNKADINLIVNHYGSPELKQIAQALDNIIGDQRNIEDVLRTVSRKSYNGIGNVASYDGPEVSTRFINRMLDFSPIEHDGSYNQLLRNIEHVKGYFK